MSKAANIISNSSILSSLKVHASLGREVTELQKFGIWQAGDAELYAPYRLERAANSELLHTTVWFILKGHIVFETPEVRLAVSPGMALVHSATTNRYCRLAKGSFRHLYFFLPYRDVPTKAFPASYSRELQELLRMLAREVSSPESNPQRRTMFCALISSYLEKELEGSPVPNRLRNMIEVIERDIAAKWTTTTLAKRLNISPSLLYQLCTQYYGESPGDIIRRTKFRYAAAMLRQSDATLDFIAERIGYGSAYAFSKAYYKFIGKRPGQDRALC